MVPYVANRLVLLLGTRASITSVTTRSPGLTSHRVVRLSGRLASRADRKAAERAGTSRLNLNL